MEKNTKNLNNVNSVISVVFFFPHKYFKNFNLQAKWNKYIFISEGPISLAQTVKWQFL